ncbi:uncharacterized protein LOC106775417 [Vigna radiata var. radiata]|uniref:Uncharacterized protein LOC106775417 n=1 Tax=Vigna radiata var. radiata TaxID=3916 RepID=A0A3Q0FKM2_VIGRR|nr:uncharacterized protein LOC106775417 [Vigna radiata var. radiata]
MKEEMREEISKMKKEYGDIRAQLKKEYSDMRVQLLAEMRAELASPLGQPRNPPQPTPLCKESCDVSPQYTSSTVNANYELFSDDALQCLVALGKMYTLGSTIHHETITTNMIRVVVVDVRVANARVPVPTQEVQIVGQAPGNFILWPIRLSRAIVKEVEAHGEANVNESLQISSQSPQLPQHTILEKLGGLAVKISLSPIEIQMPPEVTNKTFSLSFFICQRHIFDILSGTDMLCISVLQLWLLYLHQLSIERKNDHIYGFIDPVVIQEVGNKSEEVQKYLLEAFEKGKKEVYLAPYLQQGHWQLLLILPQQFLVVLLCSLHRKPHTLAIKSTLISVVKAYSRLQGTHIGSRNKLKFIAPTCSRQTGSFESGYYVMRHMQKIISANVVDSWNLIFDDTSPMEQHVIKDVREEWAAFLLTVYR